MDTTFKDMYSDLQSRIAKLDSDLLRFINQGYLGPEFNRKEREIRQLKEQLEHMNRDRITTSSVYARPYIQPSLFSTSPPLSPLSVPQDDSQFFKSTGELFRKYPPLVFPPQKMENTLL